MNRYWMKYRETKELKNEMTKELKKQDAKIKVWPLMNADFIAIYSIITIALFLFFSKPSFILVVNQTLFILTNLLFFLIWFFSSFYYKINQDNNRINKVISPGTIKWADNNDTMYDVLSDEPITRAEEDLLGREKFVNDLYYQIVRLPGNFSDSLIIGLNGSWGEGKTSVINLLVQHLSSEEAAKKIFLIRVDPWFFENEKSIINSFYDQLERSFSEKFVFRRLKGFFQKYKKMIFSGIYIRGVQFDIRPFNHTLDQMKKRIEEQIERINRKILIVMDDIDRLDPSEMAMVFKLVRKNSNFKNTIFLLSFDCSAVKKALRDKVGIDEDFIEKIINLPISLPGIDQENIERFLFYHVKMLLDQIEVAEDKAEKFFELYQSDIQKLFKTLRQAKRYLNAIRFSLPPIKSEVNPADFLILEIIKVFNEELYKNIYANKWLFVPEELDIGRAEGRREIVSLKKSTEELLKDEPEIFKKLLEELFPDTTGHGLQGYQPHVIEEYRRMKRIAHPEYFGKYFTFPADIKRELKECVPPPLF
ncbi:MAG: P-loop NTPase fold protein [Candidatus Omnitrophota bacterium]